MEVWAQIAHLERIQESDDNLSPKLTAYLATLPSQPSPKFPGEFVYHYTEAWEAGKDESVLTTSAKKSQVFAGKEILGPGGGESQEIQIKLEPEEVEKSQLRSEHQAKMASLAKQQRAMAGLQAQANTCLAALAGGKPWQVALQQEVQQALHVFQQQMLALATAMVTQASCGDKVEDMRATIKSLVELEAQVSAHLEVFQTVTSQAKGASK